MDNEKDQLELGEVTPDAAGEGAIQETPYPARGRDQRIQFIPSAVPQRTRPPRGDDDDSTFVPRPVSGRSQSVASIPQVISAKEKDRLQREKEHEKKNVNIDEHLLPHQDVAERYKTKINMDKPEDSFGLTSEQVEQLQQEHGRNVLTPPKKRHPILKYLDCLTSLFNLLLILAGVLEYILLGINFKDNFQNVSAVLHSLYAINPFTCAYALFRHTWEPSLLRLRSSTPSSSSTSSKSLRRF